MENLPEEPKAGRKILETYLSSQDEAYLEELKQQNEKQPPVSESCRIMVSMPVYKEDGIYSSLYEYCVQQFERFGEPIDPDIFEINLLLNTPGETQDENKVAALEIERFKLDYPQFHIHVFRKSFHFEGAPKMGEIFKYATDLCILRAQDTETPQIIRTSGADNEGLDPFLFRKTLEHFEENSVGLLQNEYKYRQEILERFPLVHFLDSFAKAVTRLTYGGKYCNGACAFLDELYCEVDGFDGRYRVAEDINLSRRIMKILHQHGLQFLRTRDVEAYYDPRRLISALLGNNPINRIKA